MGSSEDMCLRWTDHHSIFFNAAKELCQKQNLTDVILSCGGKIFNAHKLVLSICSNYFSDLFSNKDILGHSTVIYLRNVDPHHMELLLNFMYRGEMRIREEELSDLLDAARDLQIKGLQNDSPSSVDNSECSTQLPDPISQSQLQNTTKMIALKRNQSYSQVKSVPKMSRINQSEPVMPTVSTKDYHQPTSEIEPETIPKFISPDPSQNMNVKEEVFVEESESYNSQMDYSEFSRDDNDMFHCNICNKAFRHFSDLKTHLPVHTGEKPFTCGTCNAGFTQRGSLNRHRKQLSHW